ncbi:MAG: hypothetical protein CL669_03195 [Balneola sp.]|nr:hypothetical protein [Balneola sp.]
MKKLLLSLLITASFFAPIEDIHGQLKEIEKFLDAGGDNVEALTKAYLSPLPNGIITGLNSGWTTKAKPTKTLGFSLQLRASFATVPAVEQIFDANTIGLEGISVSPGKSSTIAGENINGQILTLPDNSTLTLPSGINFPYVPTPMVQANLGLFLGTDVTVRYVPEVDLQDFGSVDLVGVGIKHDLNQWIPGGKLLPVDLTVMAAYTQFNMSIDLEFNQGAQGQRVESATQAIVTNFLIGKTIPLLSAYAGIGYQLGDFELNMLGDYIIGSGVRQSTLTDPVSYTQSYNGGIHLIAGAQIKLALFRLFAEVTTAEYTTFNGGIGIGLRN